MTEAFPRIPNKPVVSQEKWEVAHGSIEYYKAKDNSIRRHTAHALRIVLADLAVTDQRTYERNFDFNKENIHDLLLVQNAGFLLQRNSFIRATRFIS